MRRFLLAAALILTAAGARAQNAEVEKLGLDLLGVQMDGNPNSAFIRGANGKIIALNAVKLPVRKELRRTSSKPQRKAPRRSAKEDLKKARRSLANTTDGRRLD